MKKVKYLIGGLALLAFACNKPSVVPSPSPDPIATQIFFDENVAEATQHFTVDAGADILIIGEKGTQLSLPANSLIDSEGNLVTGNVEVELIEITKKSEMIIMNKPTNGKKSNGDIEGLVSAGEFYVTISQYGIELTATEPIEVRVFTMEYHPLMRKFVNISTDEDLLWEMASDSIINTLDGEDSSGVFMEFDILPDDWGWVNCDYFPNDGSPRTEIDITLPEGFDGENTGVFISIDGAKTVVQYYSGVVIPVGTDVNFVGVGVVGDELHYTIEASTITDGHSQHLDDFSAISEDALVSLIDALP